MNERLEFDETIARLRAALHVTHVATSPLLSADAREPVRVVRSWAEAAAISNVPVVERGIVVGVLENVAGDLLDAPRPLDAQQSGQAMRRLAADMLIESTARLDRVLEVLLEPPYYRLVLREGRVDSIVTPSDLNKLPVRVVAFTMLAHLEAAAVLAIDAPREEHLDAVALLGTDEAAQVDAEWRRLQNQRLDLSPLDVTTLAQKGAILAALHLFLDSEEAVKDFRRIYARLRNPVMHVGDYVSDSLPELQAFIADLDVVRRRTDEIHGVLGQ
jgi:predicted transcriptional regulator